MKEVINIINTLFNKYYTTEEFENDDEFKMILKKKLDKVLFNIAISSLMEIKDMDTTQNVIVTGFWLNYYNKKNEVPMRKLLLQNFHNSHEDIVSLFQSQWNNDTENISVLLKALERIPEYLQPEDFKYPYVRKIIYAIGAQPQPESLLALEKLVSETNDKKIKELALHQIEKRKELGRWEFEKNNKY
ncbi:hypothetical protein EDM00_11820 [Ornithobacterium rhinotracheale]|uniref:hypothetical protein n=1 Tax=Ornithobacterium rhinotracheale TaxID=28251 RepID=UPI00129CB66E|nr:hypothetical protein [Ornithobacterium rhinotracheale]MRI64668.1 hypothetical protein [Ornithobacterium rhinotracheale]MRJ11179.1 hypothetical protein [Ornithobacterium rhinotracheale]